MGAHGVTGAVAGAALLLTIGAGCAEETVVRSDPPWAADQWAVIMAVDAAGDPRPSSLTVLPPGEVARFALEDAHRLYAMAWSSSLQGCTFEATAGTLPSPPAGRWETAVLDADQPLAWSTTTRPVDVRGTCPDTPTICRDVEVTEVDIGPTRGGLAAVHAFKQEALVGGGRATETSSAPFLMLVGDDGFTQVLGVPESQGEVVDMADTGVDIVAGTEPGDLIQLRPTLAYVGRVPGGIRRLSALEDGTLLIQRSATTSPSFAEMRFPGHALSLRPDIPDGIRVGIIAAPGIEYLGTEDGRVLRGDGRGRYVHEVSLGAVSEINDAVATASVAVVVARYSGVFVRDREGTWRDIGRPNGLGSPRAVGMLSRGRVVVGTYAGGVGIWDGGRWCSVESSARENVNALDVASDERTVWVVGSNSGRGTPPVLMRIVVAP